MFRFGDEKGQLKCSFCGKSQEQVRKLIAGPGVYICDECIELCNEIIEEELYKNVDENLRLRNIPKPKKSTTSSTSTSSVRTAPRKAWRSRSTIITSGSTPRKTAPMMSSCTRATSCS